jgi:hypothetical protein
LPVSIKDLHEFLHQQYHIKFQRTLDFSKSIANGLIHHLDNITGDLPWSNLQFYAQLYLHIRILLSVWMCSSLHNYIYILQHLINRNIWCRQITMLILFKLI